MFKSKADVRSLMKKAKQDRLPGSSHQIKDKLANYTASGNLSCILCRTQVKSAAVWPAHLRSRTHTENITALKKKAQNRPQVHTSSSERPTSSRTPHKPSTSTTAISAEIGNEEGIKHIDKDDVGHTPKTSNTNTTHVAGFTKPNPVVRKDMPVGPDTEIGNAKSSVPTPVAKSIGFSVPPPIHRESQRSGTDGGFKRPFAKSNTTGGVKDAEVPSVNVASRPKRVKVAGPEGDSTVKVSSATKNDDFSQLPADFFDSTEDKINVNGEEESHIETADSKMLNTSSDSGAVDGLPADFFDNVNTNEGDDDEIMADAVPEKAENDSALPEGFFDDYNRDAKERNIDTKKEAINEWDSFQKVMSKEQEKSEALIEEDELEYAEGRDKILGQEQRAALDRVERMKRMREQAIDNMKSKTTSATHARKEHAMKIDDDSSDDDVDELDDWRSKAF